jgi:biopolymer transport protein ExbD
MPATLGRRLGREGITAINVTPLVDVCLVLLVVLMVASTYIVSRTMQVDVPKTKTSDGAAPRPDRVVVTRDGAIRWGDRPVGEAELRRELAALVRRDRNGSLVVSADQAALHGRVVGVLDLAKQAGVRHLALHVVPAAPE